MAEGKARAATSSRGGEGQRGRGNFLECCGAAHVSIGSEQTGAKLGYAAPQDLVFTRTVLCCVLASGSP